MTTLPTEERLLPCPFCGGEASMSDDPNHSTAWEVGCYDPDCPAQPNVWQVTKAEAIAAWNRRHP